MSSDNRKKVNSWLVEISSAIGKNIGLNDDGISAFKYEELIFFIEVPDSSEQFFLYSFLMGLPAEHEKTIMRKVLNINYLQQETRGGCLSLDPVTNEIVFSYGDRIDEINGTEFRNVLENYIDTTLKVYGQLMDSTKEKSTEIAPAGSNAAGVEIDPMKLRMMGMQV